MEKLTSNILNEIEPPKYLKEAVLGRIEKEKQKQIFCKKMLYFCGFFVSGAGLLFSLIYFGREILVSDFWSISSLAFTDLKIVSAYWQEFSLSLLETFPFEALAIILVPVLILLILIKEYYKNTFKLLHNYK
jgi:hypothetical protein